MNQENSFQISKLIKQERKRHLQTLDLIASENYPSKKVREALGSIFVVKYSEGRPGKRYYAGNEVVDRLEKLVEKRAMKVFCKDNKEFVVNVQSLSGSPANYAVLRGLLEKRDKILSLSLSQGGHLSHGASASMASQDFQIINYSLDKKTNLLDYEQIKKIALKVKPELIICGYTAYPRKINFKKFKEIAEESDSYLLADISHIAGLIAADIHPSPIPYADVVTTTTHKTLRGPRGAMIICKKELKDKIFPKVFPGLQGGPHNHTIAAIGVALKEALSSEFKRYSEQVVMNAEALASELKSYDFDLVTGGTDNHLILVDLSNKGMKGQEAQNLLEKTGIIVNKNTIPFDENSSISPSGIRLGTAALTTRGMTEEHMKKIASWMNQVISEPSTASGVRKEVKQWCQKFPLF